MDFGKLMEQASRMQESLGRLEDELNATVYEGSSNGLTVKINGKMECQEIHIPEEIIYIIVDLMDCMDVQHVKDKL